MEDTQGDYIQEGDIGGMDVHMGIEDANSIGYGEGKEESLNLVETIKNLKKDVQIHQANNERLMKSKEQQEEFNMNLMQILNIIEKKLDKESGSSKSGSHRFHDEKIRTRSVNIHHHHYTRHSNRRTPSSSSSSLVRKNTKRTRMDEL
jgi:hypothetical protein